MRALKESLSELLSAGDGGRAQAAELKGAWRQVAPPAAARHTGSVIYDRKDPDVLVVFTDSSVVQAELSADRELYRVQLSRLLRPPDSAGLKEVRFAVSSGLSRRLAAEAEPAEPAPARVKPLPLSAEEERQVWLWLDAVSDERLKLSLFKAMKALKEWKKGKDAARTP